MVRALFNEFGSLRGVEMSGYTFRAKSVLKLTDGAGNNIDVMQDGNGASLDDFVKRLPPFKILQQQNKELVDALTSILGWRELRDTNSFPVERVEQIAEQALAKCKENNDE